MTSKQSIQAQARAAGILPNTVYNRMARGETLEQALSRPAKRYRVIAPAVLACVEAHPDLSAREIAQRIGETTEAVRVALVTHRRDELVVVTERLELVRGVSTLVRRYRANVEPTAEEWAA